MKTLQDNIREKYFRSIDDFDTITLFAFCCKFNPLSYKVIFLGSLNTKRYEIVHLAEVFIHIYFCQ